MFQTGNRSSRRIIYRSREYRCAGIRIVLLFSEYTYIPLGSLCLLFPSKGCSGCGERSILQIRNSSCRYRIGFDTYIQVINHHVVVLRRILIEDNIFAATRIFGHIYYKVFSSLWLFTTYCSNLGNFGKLVRLIDISRAANHTYLQYTIILIFHICIVGGTGCRFCIVPICIESYFHVLHIAIQQLRHDCIRELTGSGSTIIEVHTILHHISRCICPNRCVDMRPIGTACTRGVRIGKT